MHTHCVDLPVVKFSAFYLPPPWITDLTGSRPGANRVCMHRLVDHVGSSDWGWHGRKEGCVGSQSEAPRSLCLGTGQASEWGRPGTWLTLTVPVETELPSRVSLSFPGSSVLPVILPPSLSLLTPHLRSTVVVSPDLVKQFARAWTLFSVAHTPLSIIPLQKGHLHNPFRSVCPCPEDPRFRDARGRVVSGNSRYSACKDLINSSTHWRLAL